MFKIITVLLALATTVAPAWAVRPQMGDALNRADKVLDCMAKHHLSEQACMAKIDQDAQLEKVFAQCMERSQNNRAVCVKYTDSYKLNWQRSDRVKAFCNEQGEAYPNCWQVERQYAFHPNPDVRLNCDNRPHAERCKEIGAHQSACMNEVKDVPLPVPAKAEMYAACVFKRLGNEADPYTAKTLHKANAQ